MIIKEIIIIIITVIIKKQSSAGLRKPCSEHYSQKRLYPLQNIRKSIVYHLFSRDIKNENWGLMG